MTAEHPRTRTISSSKQFNPECPECLTLYQNWDLIQSCSFSVKSKKTCPKYVSQLGHNFMQLQLVSSKMAQMFDTLLKPGLTLPQKRQTCYIWWGVRGEGSWGFGRLSHNLLTLLSLYPPHPSEGPSSTPSLFRGKRCCCQQQQFGEANEHTQWSKPNMLCSPYTGYIIIIMPLKGAFTSSLQNPFIPWI